MGDFQTAMKAMETDARAFVKKAGLDPDNMPDYKAQGKMFEKAGITDHEKIPAAIKNAFPAAGIELGQLSAAHTDALGLKQAPILRLSPGTGRYGIAHNWKHHKEMFTDLADSQKVLEETIGNPNARCVLSITVEEKRLKKLLVFYNPDTQAYCVSRLKGNGVVEIMSWHHAKAEYGNDKWNKN